ncbi:MAG: tetratricopeptide repeat protein [Proteobacteria bacterium]|nr:tetratricopeptide repeat protein [Pseudomonadota bacterium]
MKGLRAWLSRRKAPDEPLRDSGTFLWESVAAVLANGSEETEQDRAALLDWLDGTARELLEGCLAQKDQLDGKLVDHLRSWILKTDFAESTFAEGKLWEWLKRTQSAESSYRACLSRLPSHSKANNQLGLLLLAKDQYDEAIACLGSAIQSDPGNAIFHNNLGIALWQVGELDDAFSRFHKAWELDPAHPDIRRNLYNAATELNFMGVAKEVVDHALSARKASCGDLGEALSGLSNDDPEWPFVAQADLAQKSGDLEQAESLFQALLSKDYLAGRTGLGMLSQTRGDFASAASSFREVAAYNPGNPGAQFNLAVALASQGDFDNALDSLDRSIRIDPTNPRVLYMRATLCLSLGRWEEGWRDYESRLRFGEQLFLYVDFDRGAIWRGESLVGKTVALVGEQGVGDQIQFVRFATKLAESGAEVVVYCGPELKRLVASVPGVAKVCAKGDPFIPYDFWIPMLSLPRVLNINSESFQVALPYVAPQLKDRQYWHSRLGQNLGLKVGVVWSGNPNYGLKAGHLDRRRSLPLELLAPLWEARNVTFYSLQKGRPREQIDAFSLRHELVDYSDEWADYADTAAFMVALDLVITVDTSVAHLAGALAKPVWILSRYDACWRWLNHREDSPWYPSARLFRQEPAESWAPVVKRVANALCELVKGNERS